MTRAISSGMIAALFLSSQHALSADQDPYQCRDRSWLDRIPEIDKELKNITCKEMSQQEFTSACLYATKAEIYKRDGKYEAEDCYQKAIQVDPIDPAYELFCADYLRNFRGTGVPLQRFEEIGSPLIPEAQ